MACTGMIFGSFHGYELGAILYSERYVTGPPFLRR